jgi:hypothetical protein
MFQKIKTKLKNLDALDRMIIIIATIVIIWQFIYGSVDLDDLTNQSSEKEIQIIDDENNNDNSKQGIIKTEEDN